MRLLVLRSLWTNGYSLERALEDCRSGAFDGVEGPVPETANERVAFVAQLNEAGVPFMAEICTAGPYVPNRSATLEEHLGDLERRLEQAEICAALGCTVLAGCDAWPISRSVEFFSRALEVVGQSGLLVSFETHRSRSAFNPWATAELIRQVPGLRLTCDFSHWCVVAERLVMDTESELLLEFAERAAHIHGRVGYAQGPQVPNPAAPEYGEALDAHERWWSTIWKRQAEDGRMFSTITPEFGPDGYLTNVPFTQEPLANLDEVNRWMAARLKQRFAEIFPV